MVVHIKNSSTYMDTERLHYFITVAKTLNITQTAEELHICQPALSKHISELETELHAKLFDRTPRLRLTEAGKAFLAEAHTIQDMLKQAKLETRRIHEAEQAGTSGYLTVGFTSAMTNGVLPNIFRTFKARYPDVKLILCEESSSNRIAKLRDLTVDIMFFYYEDRNFLKEKDLVTREFGSESLVVILPENHQLATKNEIKITDLKDEDLILPDPQFASGLSEEIINLYERANIEPKIALQAVFALTILGLVSGEIGISILPDSIENLQRTGVVYRPIAGQPSRINQLSAVYRKDDSSVILENFLNIIE
jgi:DNA-binding transcriptional LysR family regulator